MNKKKPIYYILIPIVALLLLLVSFLIFQGLFVYLIYLIYIAIFIIYSIFALYQLDQYGYVGDFSRPVIIAYISLSSVVIILSIICFITFGVANA